ncbi:MAG: zinc-dependent alcohol dehydrogenase family protein [Chloroflexi bacterium]|nr:zinc-dependent alcohol dehydrogenase family protein [Chloroflexota bacterium]
MQAMLLTRITDLAQDPQPLTLAEVPTPRPGEGEVLLQVTACGVCHTELDEIEGRTPPPRLPVIPGHQAVGMAAGFGPGARRWKEGDRLGVAWIFSACGACPACRSGFENLCPDFRATGRDANGGYAGYMVAPQDFAHRIPPAITDELAAPLLCAGAIGYRSLRLAGLADGQRLGLTGFGASAHLTLLLAKHLLPHSPVFVFARSPGEQVFARQLGAAWAGDTGEIPPENLEAVIDTTPAWQPALAALRRLAPGGRLVINAIRKEANDQADLLGLDYPAQLWLEKEIKSVANVTRRDVQEFLELAAAIPIRPEVETYPLAEANQALLELRSRRIRGGKVLKIT